MYGPKWSVLRDGNMHRQITHGQRNVPIAGTVLDQHRYPAYNVAGTASSSAVTLVPSEPTPVDIAKEAVLAILDKKAKEGNQLAQKLAPSVAGRPINHLKLQDFLGLMKFKIKPEHSDHIHPAWRGYQEENLKYVIVNLGNMNKREKLHQWLSSGEPFYPKIEDAILVYNPVQDHERPHSYKRTSDVHVLRWVGDKHIKILVDASLVPGVVKQAVHDLKTKQGWTVDDYGSA